MSKFVRHESCPSCGSKDNLGRYDDGHAWCFGCGYKEPPKHRAIPSNEESHVTIPTDLMKQLPFLYNRWLDSYNLTPEEKSFFKWSPSLKRMVTFVMQPGQGLFWEGRSLTTIPKSLNYGKKPFALFYQGRIQPQLEGDKVVIVEDVVSAIKVGRYLPTLCLFGNNLQENHMKRIALQFKEVVVWLDDDKYKKGIDIARETSLYCKRSVTICTKQDPKYYNNILDILVSRGIIDPPLEN
jgi:hypothetical protein